MHLMYNNLNNYMIVNINGFLIVILIIKIKRKESGNGTSLVLLN